MSRVAFALFLAACGAPPPVVDDTAAPPSELLLDAAPALLDIDTISGEVHLVTHEESSVEIVPIVINEDDAWDWVEEADGTLRVFSTCPNGSEGCSTGFSVVAPVDQAYAVRTSSGRVALEAEYAGTAAISTNSGDVQGRDLQGAAVTVESETGRVDLEFAGVPASITVTTTSGAIDVEVPPGSYTLDVFTNGELTIEGISQGSGPSVYLHSNSGAVTIRAATR